MPHHYILLILLAATGIALIVWIGNVSRVGTQVETCLKACSEGKRKADNTMRIMTLNVLHGFPTMKHLPRRLDLIATEILRQDLDIVFLQEVPWTPRLGSAIEYLSQRVGMNYVYLRANGNRHAILFEEGVAILSRYPLQDPTFVELEPQPWFFEHRVVLRAIAMTPWGNVDVFVTHLTLIGSKLNQQQASSLKAFVDNTGSGFAIVAGDFNATGDSPQIKALSQEWMDAYRAANPQAQGPTCCIGDLSGRSDEALRRRIDYLFLVPRTALGIKLRSAQRVLDQPFELPNGWQWVSDHVGVLAVIEIQQ